MRPDEAKRVIDAIQSYADHQPLDLLEPGQIQKDLRAIAGERHRHRRMIGSDACLLCRLDLRNDIHLRAGETS